MAYKNQFTTLNSVFVLETWVFIYLSAFSNVCYLLNNKVTLPILNARSTLNRLHNLKYDKMYKRTWHHSQRWGRGSRNKEASSFGAGNMGEISAGAGADPQSHKHNAGILSLPVLSLPDVMGWNAKPFFKLLLKVKYTNQSAEYPKGL